MCAIDYVERCIGQSYVMSLYILTGRP